jgi:hypothetical protein
MISRFFNPLIFFFTLHPLIPIDQLIQLDTIRQHDRVGAAAGVKRFLKLLFPGGDLLFKGCDWLETGFSHGLEKAVSVLSDVGHVGHVGEKIKNGWEFWVD